MKFADGRYPHRFAHQFILVFLIGMMGLVSFEEVQARRRIRSRSKNRSHSSSVAKQTGTRAAVSKSNASFGDWESRIVFAEQTLGEKWTVHIEDLDSTRTIYQYQPTLRLIPASNRKLITFGLAMETLGADYQFTTEFGLSAKHDPGRVHYHGDVILRADGDPSLTDPFLRGNKNPADIFRTWGEALKSAGIAYIHGNIVIDASAFGSDQNSYPIVWDISHRNNSYAPVPSALTICQNLLRVSVAPGSRSGSPGRITLFPSEEGVEVVNNTRTSSRGRSGLSASFDEENSNLLLSGSVPERGGQEVALVPLPHPLQYIAQLLRQSIEEAGVRQTGDVVIKTDKKVPVSIAERLGLHESPPLAQMLLLMMRQSNNFLAEQIWRAAAARAGGCGDVSTARQVEQKWYNQNGLSWIEPGWDGCGLSRRDAFASSDLVGIARYLYGTAHQRLMLKVMPTSGRSGTLRHRTSGNLDGRITAKTGTLAGVSALTGFIRDRKGQPRMVFSVIGNARGETNGRLIGRINDLLQIAILQLDHEIATGARPGTAPGGAIANEAEDQALNELLSQGATDTTSETETSGESASD